MTGACTAPTRAAIFTPVNTIVSETRERFLVAIGKEIDPGRIEELHFFPHVRQGGVETGVAVVAASLPVRAIENEVEDGVEDGVENVADVIEDGVERAVRGEPAGGKRRAQEAADGPSPPRRITVYSAAYRLVLKGPDRGRWETTIVEEADAPFLTVEAVVRGVQRRAGDVEPPERMDGEAARAIVMRAG